MRKFVLVPFFGTLAAVFGWALWSLDPQGRSDLTGDLWDSLKTAAFLTPIIILPLFALIWWIDRHEAQPPRCPHCGQELPEEDKDAETSASKSSKHPA